MAPPDLNLGTNEGFPLADVQLVDLGEPYVAIDSGAFIEPAIAIRCVHAHDKSIGVTVVEEVVRLRIRTEHSHYRCGR